MRIVFWDDDTKTVVKAQNGEAVDYEKGLAMAISKKALGNKGNYYNTFEKIFKEEYKKKKEEQAKKTKTSNTKKTTRKKHE